MGWVARTSEGRGDSAAQGGLSRLKGELDKPLSSGLVLPSLSRARLLGDLESAWQYTPPSRSPLGLPSLPSSCSSGIVPPKKASAHQL